ncbi:hypothetical protein MSAN_00981900 [Mycena sanguinolenta]|uniref:Uncharacterized protein n=1 Tax=Mycena sanguinolenta TaxID=230812 RepID=A0A8H7D8Z4_9AGAR|nr:hypothetical protein MSAN_00981900 [Mycena sanguinolenta]
MQRPVISYDDITLPYHEPDPGPPSNANDSFSGSSQSSKKRKRSKGKSYVNQNNTANVPAEHETGDDEDADSRYLTHEEIWDDSALIDAWNAATEEYEALNGPDKGWKTEPVHKSPLWYNVPPTKPPNKKTKTESTAANLQAGPSRTEAGGKEEEGDSQPLDFDTTTGYPFSGAVPPPSVSIASQDEAFTRALEAMYWGGYWTAVYHCHRNAQSKGADAEAEDAEGEGGDDEDDIDEGAGGVVDPGEDEYYEEEGLEEEEAFVSTQR